MRNENLKMCVAVCVENIRIEKLSIFFQYETVFVSIFNKKKHEKKIKNTKI